MMITEEMIAEDEKRWNDRNIVAELGYCGKNICNRKNITNDDIRFYAYIMRQAHAMLKEQESLLGVQQTADSITFISTGTAKQGEERGIVLGQARMHDWLEKELLYRGLLTDAIRAVFHDARRLVK